LRNSKLTVKYKIFRHLFRGINDLMSGYQPGTNILNDEKGDFVAESHSILARWREYFSQLLNVRGVSDVRQTEIHTVEPLVPDSSAFEVELATEKLKIHKLPCIGQIATELIMVGGRKIRYKKYKLIFVCLE